MWSSGEPKPKALSGAFSFSKKYLCDLRNSGYSFFKIRYTDFRKLLKKELARSACILLMAKSGAQNNQGQFS
jgi:hypothetical protein